MTRFRDVPKEHTFYEDIEWLAETGVTKGCNPPVNDLYCPTRQLTRAEMAAMMHRYHQYLTAEVPVEPPVEPPIEPPPIGGMFIPAYKGTPDVGLLWPKEELTPYEGPSNIPSGVYESMFFTGRHILNDPSRFKNCWLYDGYYSILAKGGRSEFEDCELGREGAIEVSRLIYGSGGTFDMLRCNLHDAEDPAKMAYGARFTMCHIHDLKWLDHPDTKEEDKRSPHYDGIQADGSVSPDSVIEYCHIDSHVRDAPNYVGNAAVFLKTDIPFAPNPPRTSGGATIRNNYLNGGNRTMSLRWEGTNNVLKDMIVKDNIFGPDFKYDRVRIDEGAVAVWEGNVDENGVAV
jgi:hypothetical protein